MEQWRRRMMHRRAVEAAVWGMPAVNFELMRGALSPGVSNQFVYWSHLLDWRNQTLTPNPDLVYYLAFLDTRETGPLVVEIPACGPDQILNGSLCTVWQMPMEDVGLFGADQGQGARYLILPPAYDGEVPDGYVVLACDTSQSYMLIRSVLGERTQEALDRGLEICQRIRVYPLSEADDPTPNKHIDLFGQVVDTRIPYDLRFFEALDRIVQAEPLLPRDRPFAEMLATIGIRRGQPFAPDDEHAEILQGALVEAHELLRELLLHDGTPWVEGGQWFFPVSADMRAAQNGGYANDDVYPYTNRGMIYHLAFIGLKRMGVGQFYLLDVRDGDGNLFDSARRYRLRVPPGVPVSQYWSVALYDAETHAFVERSEKQAVSSQTPGLVVEEDGSVEIHLAPAAEPGREANTIATDGCERFELMFRFYGVQAAVMTKEWTLPDVEVVEP